MKICLAASAGGHLRQLLKLAESYEQHPHFYVTSSAMVADRLEANGSRVYVVGEANRKHPIRMAAVLLRCIRAVLRERPDVVISTGAAPGCLACCLGKALGAKVVWVDSIANVERLSLSGRLVRPIADLIFSQWPEVADRYARVQYVGALI